MESMCTASYRQIRNLRACGNDISLPMQDLKKEVLTIDVNGAFVVTNVAENMRASPEIIIPRSNLKNAKTSAMGTARSRLMGEGDCMSRKVCRKCPNEPPTPFLTSSPCSPPPSILVFIWPLVLHSHARPLNPSRSTRNSQH